MSRCGAYGTGPQKIASSIAIWRHFALAIEGLFHARKTRALRYIKPQLICPSGWLFEFVSSI
jgi:hypothetical protein